MICIGVLWLPSNQTIAYSSNGLEVDSTIPDQKTGNGSDNGFDEKNEFTVFPYYDLLQEVRIEVQVLLYAGTVSDS